MPTFQITVTNDEFISSDEVDLATSETAYAMALKSALEMGCDQMLQGRPVYGAEVTVSDGNAPQRFLVTIATSPLK